MTQQEEIRQMINTLLDDVESWTRMPDSQSEQRILHQSGLVAKIHPAETFVGFEYKKQDASFAAEYFVDAGLNQKVSALMDSLDQASFHQYLKTITTTPPHP